MDRATKKKHEAAIKECAGKKQPSAADLYKWGFALLELGRNEEACTVLQRGLDMFPDDPDRNEFLYFLGSAKHNLGDHAAAIKALRESIALLPEGPESYALLGDALRMSGNPHEAADAYRKALSLALPGEEAAAQAAEGLERLRA
jgi:cytochrome c-type biogenesis protein CcmH/NrfG